MLPSHDLKKRESIKVKYCESSGELKKIQYVKKVWVDSTKKEDMKNLQGISIVKKWAMKNEWLVVINTQFKVILKEILENFKYH